jgi:hypothetical protein
MSWYMVHRYLWFETEVIARRDAPPIETEISFCLLRGNESDDEYAVELGDFLSARECSKVNR